jgi:hypothetical protein
MSNMQVSRLEPEALNRVMDALVRVGVAGNEADRRFEAQDLQASLRNLEERLRETAYRGGSLAIGTLARPHDDVGILVYDSNQYQGMDQAELAWERDYQDRWHQGVECRAKDWIERLGDLRTRMADWVKETPEFAPLQLVDLPSLPMSEELMRRFAVPSEKMPAFELRAGSKRVMRFQPKGLWIIGANGRVDLTTKSAARILVDKSEPLARPSVWQMYDSRNRASSVPLTAETFKEFVRSGL